MNIEEIRRGAPEGSTYYCISNQGEVFYFKRGAFDWILYYSSGFWNCANQDVLKYLKPL